MGDSREAQEGGDITTPMVNSSWCMAEIKSILKSNHQPTKIKYNLKIHSQNSSSIKITIVNVSFPSLCIFLTSVFLIIFQAVVSSVKNIDKKESSRFMWVKGSIEKT